MGFLRFLAVAAAPVSLLAPAAHAQDPATTPAATPAAESAPETNRQPRALRWEHWETLHPQNPDLPRGGVQLRADGDAEAVYLRFHVEPWLPFTPWTEAQPAWRFALTIHNAANPSQAYLRLDLADDAREDQTLENGIRVLESTEPNGAHRVELRIPRLLLGEAVPWNADGPAVALGLLPVFELGNWAPAANPDGALVEVIEVDDQGNEIPPSAANSNAANSNAANSAATSGAPNPWPPGNRFGLQWDADHPQPGTLPIFGS